MRVSNVFLLARFWFVLCAIWRPWHSAAKAAESCALRRDYGGLSRRLIAVYRAHSRVWSGADRRWARARPVIIPAPDALAAPQLPIYGRGIYIKHIHTHKKKRGALKRGAQHRKHLIMSRADRGRGAHTLHARIRIRSDILRPVTLRTP